MFFDDLFWIGFVIFVGFPLSMVGIWLLLSFMYNRDEEKEFEEDYD